MGNFHWSKIMCILNLVLLSNSILSVIADDDDDVSRMEKSIYNYHKYVSGLMWKWISPLSVCRKIYPENSFLVLSAQVKKANATMESINCIQIEMEILKCFWKKYGNTARETAEYVRGVNGESYQVLSPGEESKCHDGETPVIKKCVEDNNSTALDFSEIENLFYQIRGFVELWKWDSPDVACPRLQPDPSDFSRTQGHAKIENVLLNSQGAHVIPMEILECVYEKEITVDEYVSWTEYYAKGVNSEAYQMLPMWEGENLDKKVAFTIWRRVLDSSGARVEPLCPSLTAREERP